MNNSTPSQVWEKAKERLDKMTPEERIQNLIDCGILTETGEVAEFYRDVIKQIK